MEIIQDNSFSEDIRRTKREIAYIEVVFNGFRIYPEAYSYDMDRFKFILNNVSARPQDYTVVFKDQLKGDEPASAPPPETHTKRSLNFKSVPVLAEMAKGIGIDAPEDADKKTLIDLILAQQ